MTKSRETPSHVGSESLVDRTRRIAKVFGASVQADRGRQATKAHQKRLAELVIEGCSIAAESYQGDEVPS